MGTSLGWPATGGGATGLYMELCLEPLLQQMMDGSYNYRLATGYKLADDMKSVTFNLRQGVKFHDGSDFNADVAKFNFDAMLAAKKGNTTNWDSTQVVDNYTIKINYKKWTSWVLNDFTYSGGLFIVSKASYDKNGIDWTKTHMIGTGPFKQVSWEQDVAVKFEKYTDYWQKGKPYLDKLEALCVIDPMTMQASMLAGEADILNSEADKKVVDMKNKGLQAISRPVGVINIFPDSANSTSPLANQQNREAIEYAIDKDTLSKTLQAGFFTPAYQMAPPTIAAFNPAIVGRKYDPAKAKQLLAQAGNPSGFKFTIIPCPVVMFNDTAVAIQADLAKVGIQGDVQMITDAKFFDYVMGTWSNTGVLAAVSSCIPNWAQALSGFFNPDGPVYKPMLRSDAFKAAFSAAAYSPTYDIAKTQALLKEMYDEEMVIPLFNCSEAWVYQSYVKDAWTVWPAGLQMWSPENTWLAK